MLHVVQELCVGQVAGEFQRSTLNKVPKTYHKQIIELLPPDLPLELAGQAIQDETYWKRRSQARWSNCDTLKHGGSYKQLYFERNLQDAIEECVSNALKLHWLHRCHVDLVELGGAELVQVLHCTEVQFALPAQLARQCKVMYSNILHCTLTSLKQLCRFDTDSGKLDDLKRLLAFSQRFVSSLSLVQLPSHLELDILFDGLGKCASS
jgi:hypothetical protein